jgi:acetolactate synthase regulatory subunit
MQEVAFELEIHDQPDVLVRIIQIMHRRGGHIRQLQIDPGEPWALAKVIVNGIANPEQITLALEKLIDVHHVEVVTK